MPHTLTPESTLLDDLMAEVQAKSDLVDRVARHAFLLAEHAIGAGEFVDSLYPDEQDFFASSTSRQLRPAIKRWLD